MKKQKSIPFTSSNSVRRYVEKIGNGEAKRKDLEKRIDLTVKYFLGGTRNTNILRNGPEAIWRRAKSVEVVRETEKSFPMSIPPQH
jgi:hypothetical protein